MLHIFFLFECIPTPVKYYGSRLGYPLTSNTIGATGATGATGAIGILGVLGVLGGIGWALGLPTSSTALIQRNEPSSPKLQPCQPTLRPSR